MAAGDRVITLTTIFQLELPGGNVNLCSGGFVDFDAGSGVERFTARHATYGKLVTLDAVRQSFEAQAESTTIALCPNPQLPITDWLTDDLRDARVRFWHGEVESDFKTVTSAEQMGDYLVDYPSRVVTAEGTQMLELALMTRDQRLFLVNEGNVCSERFHKSIWPGEDGFNNCTDVPVPVAWGTAGPPTSGGNSGSFGGGGGGGTFANQFAR